MTVNIEDEHNTNNVLERLTNKSLDLLLWRLNVSRQDRVITSDKRSYPDPDYQSPRLTKTFSFAIKKPRDLLAQFTMTALCHHDFQDIHIKTTNKPASNFGYEYDLSITIAGPRTGSLTKAYLMMARIIESVDRQLDNNLYKDLSSCVAITASKP